jgi:phosphopantothenoylcysteine synthetase/decarboxylase
VAESRGAGEHRKVKKKEGVVIIEPEEGRLACEEEGKG